MTIEMKTLIHGSEKHIFQAWTDPSNVTQWLCSYAEINPKKGGKYWLFFSSHDNMEHFTKGCQFLKYDAFRTIEFSWKGPKKYADIMNIEGYLTNIQIVISPIDQDSCNVVLTHYGWKSSEDWQKARLWHIDFWKDKLDNFQQFIEW